jgi:PKD repeat protein
MRKNSAISLIMFFVFFLAFGFLSYAEEFPIIVVTGNDRGSEIELPANAMLQIRLDLYPSTGHFWLIEKLDQDLVRQLGEAELESASDPMPGSRADQVFTIVSENAGLTEIKLKLYRPWEPDVRLDSFSISVRTFGKTSVTYQPKSAEVPAEVEIGEPNRALPAQFNWCDQGKCTPIKNQGSCGSCWAFAQVAPTESVIAIGDNVMRDLSEQFVVSCNEDGWSCNGGWYDFDMFINDAIGYQTAPGVVYEADKPYTATNGTCSVAYPAHEKMKSWGYAGTSSGVPTVTQIKEAIYNYGPVAVAVYATSAFQSYSGGIFTTNASGTINHAVALTGWNDADGGYWYLRNSWGTGWGESGYMRIKWGVNQVGYRAAWVDYEGAAPTPVDAKFTYSKNGKTVTFTDQSTTSGTIQSWSWTFGDGTTSTVKNPVKTYANYGTYTVKLTVSDNLPSTDSDTQTVIVADVPPDPCASAGTDYSYFWFTNIKLGTLNNNSVASGYSDFTNTVAAPELKQGAAYDLLMTLNTAQYTNWFKAYIDYNRDGDFADSGEVIYVSAAAAKIQSDGGQITVPASAALGVTRLRVQVKNSTSTNLPAPEPCETFAYGEVEDYYVKIIANDCPTPVAGFNYSVNQCVVTFTNTSTSSGYPIVSNNWNFGDGTTSTLASPSHTYAANGNYNVTLSVTNSCGKSASITKAVAITNCGSQCPYDHLVGSFPDIGIWERDSQTKVWTQLSKQKADIIRLGDVNGNGLDDMAAYFKATGKLWYRYDSGIWEDIPASAATLVVYDLGDMNNDGRQDLVGSWSDKGLWWRNNATGVWTKLSTMIPTLVAAGDFDGDNKADVVGLFPSLNSIWIYYSNNTWKQISKQVNLVDLRVGNMDSDVKAELVGSWDIGVWVFDPETNNWVKHHASQAKQIAVGDINAGCMQDIVGYWDAATPLYVKYMETAVWEKLSNYNPDTIDAGKTK